MSTLPISAAQCRAGRAFIGWSQVELASKARVSRKTVADFESGRRQLYRRTLISIMNALQAAGVVFGPDHGVELFPGPRTDNRGDGAKVGGLS